MSDTNNDPTRLNQMAAAERPEPGAAHQDEVVALYETNAKAEAARQALLASGVPEHAIQMVARVVDAKAAARPPEGLWGTIKTLFMPAQDRYDYSHAVARGHAMVIVHLKPGVDRTALVRQLEATSPVDFDALLEQWRQAGLDRSTPHHEFVTTGLDTQPAAGAARRGQGGAVREYGGSR